MYVFLEHTLTGGAHTPYKRGGIVQKHRQQHASCFQAQMLTVLIPTLSLVLKKTSSSRAQGLTVKIPAVPQSLYLSKSVSCKKWSLVMTVKPPPLCFIFPPTTFLFPVLLSFKGLGLEVSPPMVESTPAPPGHRVRTC